MRARSLRSESPCSTLCGSGTCGQGRQGRVGQGRCGQGRCGEGQVRSGHFLLGRFFLGRFAGPWTTFSELRSRLLRPRPLGPRSIWTTPGRFGLDCFGPGRFHQGRFGQGCSGQGRFRTRPLRPLRSLPACPCTEGRAPSPRLKGACILVVSRRTAACRWRRTNVGGGWTRKVFGLATLWTLAGGATLHTDEGGRFD